MSFRTWMYVFALIGLTAATSGNAQEEGAAADQSAAEQQNQAIELPNPLPVIIIESDETAVAREGHEAVRRQQEKDDLAAQQGMNSATQAMNAATQSMKWASWVSTGLVFLGTLLLIWTLCLTRSANRAANRAVTITEKIGRDQSRAYVHVKSVRWLEDNESSEFTVFVENSGATPVKRFEVFAECFTKDPKIELPIRIHPAEMKGWNGLPSNEVFNLKIAPKFIPDEHSILSRNTLGVYLIFRGVVRYTTIFGETFESEFSFMGRGHGEHDESNVKYGRLGRKMSRTTEVLSIFEPVV